MRPPYGYELNQQPGQLGRFGVTRTYGHAMSVAMLDDDCYVIRIVERATSAETIEGRRCFACGGPPSTGQGEHVMPLWLQNRFGLLDQRLTLLNGTLLPYRQLTVPCCQTCNNGILRGLENRVIEILEKSGEFSDADRLILAQWLCKMFLGILVKESSLAFDRRDPSKGNIVPAALLEEFHHLQLLLQSARKTTAFRCLHGAFPCTIFAYRILADPGFGDFDLSTHFGGQSIAIRFGTIGAIFVNDGGLQLHAGEKGPWGVDGLELHPLQFSEIAARAHYKSSLRDATHRYTSWETPTSLTIEQMSVMPMNQTRLPDGDMQIFRQWQNSECAELIARHCGCHVEDIYDETNDGLATVVVDENDELISPDKFKPQAPAGE